MQFIKRLFGRAEPTGDFVTDLLTNTSLGKWRAKQILDYTADNFIEEIKAGMLGCAERGKTHDLFCCRKYMTGSNEANEIELRVRHEFEPFGIVVIINNHNAYPIFKIDWTELSEKNP